MLTKNRFSHNCVFLAIFQCCKTDVLRLLRQHASLFENKQTNKQEHPSNFTWSDLIPRHLGFYPPSALLCPFVAAFLPVGRAPALLHSRSLFTHTLSLTEHNRACECYCSEDDSSAQPVKTMPSVHLEINTTNSLKTLMHGFSFQLALTPTAPLMHTPVPSPCLHPGTQLLCTSKH